MSPKNQLSRIPIYFITIAIFYSWSIFIIIDAWYLPKWSAQNQVGEHLLVVFAAHILAMFGPALSGIVLWKFVLHQSLPTWRWSRLRYYLYGTLAMLLLWTLPAVIGTGLFDSLYFRININENYLWFAAGSLTILWLAGMGEELGWCGFLLSYLPNKFSKTHSLIISGALRGIWHFPVLFGPALYKYLNGNISFLLLLLLAVFILFQLILSNILFGSLFGYLWFQTKSLPLLGWLHQWFDAARDLTILFVIGYGQSFWMKFSWGLPFYITAYLLLARTAQKEGVKLFGFRNNKNYEYK